MGTSVNLHKVVFNHIKGLNLGPVAWPNTTFPPDGEEKTFPYLEGVIIPGGVSTINYCGGRWLRGLVQVNVVIRDDTSLFDGLAVVDAVMAGFPRNTRLVEGGTTVGFYDEPYYGKDRPHYDGKFFPVTIPYEIIE